MIEFKEGCVIVGLHPKMQVANCLVYDLFLRYGVQKMVITHGLDGTHGPGSLHLKRRACDYRIWDIPSLRLNALAAEAQQILGDDYDVILEPTHIHIEYDPDRPGS